MRGKVTEFGFEWGPSAVERGFSDQKHEWVTLLLRTERYPTGMQIYVTKTGKVRIFSPDGREWKATDAKYSIRDVKRSQQNNQTA